MHIIQRPHIPLANSEYIVNMSMLEMSTSNCMQYCRKEICALQKVLNWNVKNYPFCFSSLLEHKEHKENLINVLSFSPKFNSNTKYAIKGLNIRQKSNLGWLSYLYKYIKLTLMGPYEKWYQM